MIDDPTSTYEDDRSLRNAAEKALKRALSDTEWADYEPEWAGPFDDADVAEIINAIKDSSTQRRKPSPEEMARKGRIARSERTARHTRELVESQRMDLFGQPHAPFSNRGAEAAEWIESQVGPPESKRFAIEFTIPAHLNKMESIIWVKDHLTRQIECDSNGDVDDAALGRFLESSGNVRLTWSMPMLDYVGVNAGGEPEIKCVRAPDGTLLGRLQNAGEQLAKELAWKSSDAVHHLLTGGIIAYQGVQVSGKRRTGRRSFGDLHPMILTISDPASVTEQELVTAYRNARSNNLLPWSKSQRKRSRAASKSSRVAEFVEGTPDMSWAERKDDWNRRNPEERYREESAMKSAYKRASDRQLQ